MPQNRPTGGDVADPDPRVVRDRSDLTEALLLLKARSNLSYRRLERVTAEAPGARFGLPFTTIRDYIQGRSLPTADRLDQILWACRVTDPEARAEWARALRRAADAGTQAPAVDPYGGLPAYGVEDAGRFHGRARLTADLIDRVRALDEGGGVLAVVGASGAGTTSLLHAGLVATLRRDEPARSVRYGTPGVDPAGRLAELLGAEASGPASGRPVVVLDQLEQVFTAPGPARTGFLAMLERAVTGPAAAVVVFGLRADRAALARREPVLAGALGGRELVVGPMTADELRSAIVEPAAAAGRTVGDGLVELLLHELRAGRGNAADDSAAHAPGALALLSLALSATWTHADGVELTVADYRAAGGLDGAAARAAETGYGGLTAEQQRVARAVFLRLVRTTADTDPARRRVPDAELAELPGAAAVVERLACGRVLTVSDGAVEITHDGLLHAWPRLTGWLDEDRTGHVMRGTLTEAAWRWHDGGDDEDLLLGGRALTATVDWAAGAPGDELVPTELRYLRASLARDARDHAAAHLQVRRLRLTVALLALLTTVLAGLTGIAYLTRPDATALECPAPPTAVVTLAPTERSVEPPS